MSLGDGCICKKGYLNIHHSEEQLEYITWKRNLLIKLGFECSELLKRRNTSTKNKYSYSFICKGKKLGKYLRKLMYSPKKDYFSETILNNITPLGLAIWYMDDGQLRYIKDKDKNIRGNMLQIHTCCTEPQADFLIKFFRNQGLLFKKFKEHKYTSIYCSTRYARRFLRIVEPYIRRVPSMYYKVDRIKRLTFRSSTTNRDIGVLPKWVGNRKPQFVEQLGDDIV